MSPPVARPARPLHASVIVVVALGAVAGALARWGLATAFPDDTGSFPWTVFSINVAGSFALALLPAFAAVRRNPLLPPMLGTGVLGGFTTLSTASEQTRALLAGGHAAIAAAYLLGTLAAALVAVAAADRFSTVAARAEFDEEEGDL